jgi:hypothetical protein
MQEEEACRRERRVKSIVTITYEFNMRGLTWLIYIRSRLLSSPPISHHSLLRFLLLSLRSIADHEDHVPLGPLENRGSLCVEEKSIFEYRGKNLG